MRTAILIDGGFFLRRHHALRGMLSPEETASELHRMCSWHLFEKRPREGEKRRRISHLYRIFFYDCEPLTKKAHHPLTNRAIDFSKTPTAKWRFAFHESLRKRRKVALRLGYLNERAAHWTPSRELLKDLLTGKVKIEDFSDTDVHYSASQKGVDMRVGIDIASLAFKRQVEQIVLVAGDSDFVPAAKLARREGIDFVLDPMWAQIRPDLHEHIDGLRSVIPRPNTNRDQEPGSEIQERG